MHKLLIQTTTMIFLLCLLLAAAGCGDTAGACSSEGECAGTEECIWVREGSQVLGRMCSIRCESDQECPPGTTCSGAASTCPTCNDYIQICR